MQRTVIVASKAHEKSIIEALHDLRVAHLNAFSGEAVGDLEGFRIGRPLEDAGRDSEVLVKLRSLIRHLDLEEFTPKRTFTVAELEERLHATMFDAGQEILNAAESKDRQQQHIERLAEEEQRLQPLKSLPLKLEDYHGYESLAVFTGYVTDPLGDDLTRALDQYAYFEGENGFFALFVPADKAQAANDVLFPHGFREHPVPEGTGDVSERLAQIGHERHDLEGRVSRAEATLDSLRQRHGDFLVAAEEHLTIAVAKAEAPLQFAATDNAFVVDAWVPVTESRRLEAVLDKATAGNVYVEKVPHVAHGMHGVDDIHGGEEHGAQHDERVEDQPPTRLRNGGAGKHLQYFTEMFSVPKYDEVDPTVVLSIAFPLFFGFMIGDLGLGLVMAGLGFLMFKKLGHIEGLKQLGFAIAFAGVIAALFGGFVFSDAFGIPLGVTHHMEDHLHHEHHDVTCHNIYEYLGEPTWGCLLGMGTVHAEPLIYKVTDINTMLLLSVGAAVVHLFIGLLFGIRNEWGHSTKHTVAKFGWMILLFTFFAAAVALLSEEAWTGFTGFAPSVAYMAAGVGLVLGGVILGWSEGIAGVLEIPSMFSNILSYLRLGAVAIAKGSMAISFNEMTLVQGLLSGGGMFVAMLFAFILVQALLFVLGVLSSGIQAIRLNYVEFFTKFYKGGGRKFAPFGHTRKYSIPVTAPTTGGGKL